jgi:serine/threonine protein kinase
VQTNNLKEVRVLELVQECKAGLCHLISYG